MSVNPVPRNLRGPNDNMSNWTAQFPILLPKNFLGIARKWDQQFPHITRDVLPVRNTPFNFTWRVMIDPIIMAPYVQEGGDTPFSDAEVNVESFICKEARLGAKITQREMRFGLPDMVTERITQLTDAINLTRTWENIQALLGYNAQQPLALTRLNTAEAGKPHGVGSSVTPWTDADADIIGDILAMKTDILKRCQQLPTKLIVPLNEYEALHQNTEILDQLRYTSGNLLVNGQISRIKGLDVIVCANYWKERKANGEQVKHFMLEDKVIMLAPNVGFTAVAEPRGGAAPEMNRWWDYSQLSIMIHAYSSFTTVIQDYGKIGIITGTDGNV